MQNYKVYGLTFRAYDFDLNPGQGSSVNNWGLGFDICG